MADDETPLPGQQRCPQGHVCSSRDNYCSTCGAALDPEPGDLIADGGKPVADQETHIDDEKGLFIPTEFREFEAQIVFRTPRATIQHFGSQPLDGYYGMIDESHFGDPDEMLDPTNPDLALDQVMIKPQGEEPVTLTVDTDPEIRTDGGTGRCWDHEDCPRDSCDGELQQQDRFNVMCLSCEHVWSHIRDETTHYLQTEDGVTVAQKPVAMTDGGDVQDRTDSLVVVTCAGCENRYLKENAAVLSETVVDGEVVDPDDDLERCPFCGQTTESSIRVSVTLDRSADTGGEADAE